MADHNDELINLLSKQHERVCYARDLLRKAWLYAVRDMSDSEFDVLRYRLKLLYEECDDLAECFCLVSDREINVFLKKVANAL